MAKHIDPLGIHAATRIAHAVLGDDGVVAATGKTASLARNWADPDMDQHHIQLRKAIDLDVAMVRLGYAPAHLAAFEAAVNDARPRVAMEPVREPSLTEQTLMLAEKLGALSHEVAAAMADHKLKPGEKKRLNKIIEDLKARAVSMQRVLR